MRTTVMYGIKVYSENFSFITQGNRFNTGFTNWIKNKKPDIYKVLNTKMLACVNSI